MDVCVTDDFNRANSTTSLGIATSGETWTLRPTAPHDDNDNPIASVTSILGILSNQAYGPANRITQPHGAPDYVNLATVDTGYANLDAAIDVPLGFSQGGAGGFVFRWSDTNHFWYSIIYRSIVGSGYFAYFKKVNGTVSTPFFMNIASDSATGTRRLRVKTCGSKLELFIDGALKGTITDAFNQTAKNHGPLIYFSTTARLDDLSICRAICPGGWGRRRFGGPGF